MSLKYRRFNGMTFRNAADGRHHPRQAAVSDHSATTINRGARMTWPMEERRVREEKQNGI